VLLAQLSVRTSAKGNRYLSGWLGKASVVGFPGELDKHGNETFNLYVCKGRIDCVPDGGARPYRTAEAGGSLGSACALTG
jgi:hypothetical protein